MEPTEATAQVTAVEHPIGEFIESDFDRLLAHEPDLIYSFVPDNAVEQKRAFLAGEIDRPHHHYARLEGLNTTVDRVVIKETINEITNQPDIDPRFIPAYKSFGEEYAKKFELLELARSYNAAETEDEKQRIGEEYMRVNVELYGEPDEKKYHRMLSYKLSKIDVDSLSPEAKVEYDSLLRMLPELDPSEEAMYQPDPETVEWMHNVVEALCENMLNHVPEDRDDFSPEDIRDIFREIIVQEFLPANEDGDLFLDAGSIEDWRVELADVTSITVNAAKKTIFVNTSHKNVDRQEMRKLIVHELGVHFLRSVTGGATNFPLLGRGMVDYYDFEESLGKAFEQSLDGTYQPAGVDYYIVAGSMYFDKKNFKQTQEIMWRLTALGKGKDFTKPEELSLSKASAYNAVNRLTRGTDELPWLKDLGYSKTEEVWKYLDSIRGNVTALEMLIGMGRYNPTIKADADLATQAEVME